MYLLSYICVLVLVYIFLLLLKVRCSSNSMRRYLFKKKNMPLYPENRSSCLHSCLRPVCCQVPTLVRVICIERAQHMRKKGDARSTYGPGRRGGKGTMVIVPRDVWYGPV